MERRIKVFALLVAHTEKSGVGIEWGSILGAFQWVLCQPPTKRRKKRGAEPLGRPREKLRSKPPVWKQTGVHS